MVKKAKVETSQLLPKFEPMDLGYNRSIDK